MAVTYPAGLVDKLKDRGKRFESESAPSARPPRAPAPPPPPRTDAGTVVPTSLDHTHVDPTMIAEPDGRPSFAEIDRTVPSARSPYGGLPGNADEPESQRALGASLEEAAPTARFHDRPAPDDPTGRAPAAPAEAPPARRGGCLRRAAMLGGFAGLVALLAGGAAAGGGYWYYSQDLPDIETLESYVPPTVTVVLDHQGRRLGEIYDERRYVVPLDEIPEHVQHAFISAEDANFWTHGGVDFLGLTRAMIQNLRERRMAQGASTITQQVTRNFLLDRDKRIERKIKEILLARRIEGVYDKEHILYLYLNEIFLGSSAYGVEAASRVYFGKGVSDITLAEAALLAGLPQRPSDYSPHRRFEAAKARQRYVLRQMVRNGYITQEEADAAEAEEIAIVRRENVFLTQAPHFTEHVRRYLVDRYGEDRVLREGLQVTTTCDLELQQKAQQAVYEGVHVADQRIGFRREGLTTLADDAAIAATRAEHEQAMRQAWARAQDAAGRVPPPERSVLEPGSTYDAVVLEVQPRFARVGIGDHEAIVPLAWSGWLMPPNPRRSFRFSSNQDLTTSWDTTGDGQRDGPILRKGDVVLVKVEALSTRDEAVASDFRRTPGADTDLVAARIWQVPEVEGALLSYDLETGAVRAMIGGADFRRSQFNRATQALRQVGSTFKPMVYAAAIETERMTAASMVADAPLAFATADDFVWKPVNFGRDYEGNMTLRRALALSKNTCTVRVLESIDPGMNDDVIYDFARKLGIGGPPSHTLPEDWVPRPDNDRLCPWVRETRDSTICMDRFPPKDPELSNTAHRRQLTDDDEYWCRACDLSMALGSASLTMDELLRAYSPFATGGKLIEPFTILEVRDRFGNVLESHEPSPHPQVVDPAVASVTNWLMRSVVTEGTAAVASRLGLPIAGKTGTTNDMRDAWFVGFTPTHISGVWVGFDQPQSLGVSATGGRTALPIWMDYMGVAGAGDRGSSFRTHGDIEWAQIDETTGRRVSSGGRSYPFLRGTVPASTGAAAGQLTLEDLSTDL